MINHPVDRTQVSSTTVSIYSPHQDRDVLAVRLKWICALQRHHSVETVWAAPSRRVRPARGCKPMKFPSRAPSHFHHVDCIPRQANFKMRIPRASLWISYFSRPCGATEKQVMDIECSVACVQPDRTQSSLLDTLLKLYYRELGKTD